MILTSDGISEAVDQFINETVDYSIEEEQGIDADDITVRDELEELMSIVEEMRG